MGLSEASKHRAVAAGANHLGVLRAFKESCGGQAAQDAGDLKRVKRIARYMACRMSRSRRGPRLRRAIASYVDSRWAGCRRSR